MTVELLSQSPVPGDRSMSFLVVTLILVGSLIAKETMASVPDPRARSVGRVLDVVVVPLLVVFAATVALQAIPAPP